MSPALKRTLKNRLENKLGESGNGESLPRTQTDLKLRLRRSEAIELVELLRAEDLGAARSA